MRPVIHPPLRFSSPPPPELAFSEGVDLINVKTPGCGRSALALFPGSLHLPTSRCCAGGALRGKAAAVNPHARRGAAEGRRRLRRPCTMWGEGTTEEPPSPFCPASTASLRPRNHGRRWLAQPGSRLGRYAPLHALCALMRRLGMTHRRPGNGQAHKSFVQRRALNFASPCNEERKGGRRGKPALKLLVLLVNLQ